MPSFGRNQWITLAIVAVVLVSSWVMLPLVSPEKLAIWLPWAGDFAFQAIAVIVGGSTAIKVAEALRGHPKP